MGSKLAEIMNDAQTFYNSKCENHQPITWADYEYFKRKLIAAELYGYEKQLAAVLHI